MIVVVVELLVNYKGKDIFLEMIKPGTYRRMNFPYRSDFTHFEKWLFSDGEFDLIHQWLSEKEVDKEEIDLYDDIPEEYYSKLIFKSEFGIDD